MKMLRREVQEALEAARDACQDAGPNDDLSMIAQDVIDKRLARQRDRDDAIERFNISLFSSRGLI